MQGSKNYLWVGVLLIVVGVVFLLQTFGLFENVETMIMALLFGAGGLIFLGVFAANREHWWAIIPGFTLLGLAVLIGFGDRLQALGGALFLGAIGLSFWVIYAVRRQFWWAVIPGGTLLTLAVVAGLTERVPGTASGGIFFLGLAATFLLVYLLSSPPGQMKWALIPAGVLGVMGVLLILSLGTIINYVWAIALILGGAALLYWGLVARR